MTLTRWFPALLTAALLSLSTVLMPSLVLAECGGGLDPKYLARYAAQHAEVIALGRLTAFDLSTGYTFEVLTEYRGKVASPIGPAGVTDVGGCTQQTVKAGEKFIYVAGDRPGYPRMQLMFPHVPGKGWVISHQSDYAPLDTLLDLLTTLPSTSTDTPNSSGPTPSAQLLIVLAIVGGLMAWAGKRAPADQGACGIAD